MAGVIGHIANPSMDEAVGLATSAEAADATWIGLADAFWWRDVWMLLGSVAAATRNIEIGPAMTNPYMRHRFHTASALATLGELAPGRVFCGVAAGGSELSAAADVSRIDAADRVRELVGFLDRVATTGLLDEPSGRTLELSLERPPILVAGRGEEMLKAAGETADRVLLWAIPVSDLQRTVAAVREAASERDVQPELVWAPLISHADAPESSIMHVAVYASLNTAAPVREGWGLDRATVAAMRAELVAGDLAAATNLVPSAALEDLVLDGSGAGDLATIAQSLGVTSLAVPGFAPDTVGGHVRWAASVEALLA